MSALVIAVLKSLVSVLSAGYLYHGFDPVNDAPVTRKIVGIILILSTIFVVLLDIGPIFPSHEPGKRELEYWDNCKVTPSVGACQAYLDEYPDGEFIRLAKQKLQILQQVALEKPIALSTLPPSKSITPYQPDMTVFEASTVKPFAEPAMVTLKSGCFKMGSPPSEAKRGGDERRHNVCLNQDFELGKYEVSKGEFSLFVADTHYQTEAETDGGCYGWTGSAWRKDEAYTWQNSSFPQTEAQPVTCVSWNDAQAYVAWLNAKTGKAYHLPTEAQWEYAARAGTTTAFYTGKCINTAQANYKGLVDYYHCGADTGVYKAQTTAVGAYPANPWGLYDMAGNVWEWTCSVYQENYAGNEVHCDCHSQFKTLHVVRGGGWDYEPLGLRSAQRAWFTPARRLYDLGFRLARF